MSNSLSDLRQRLSMHDFLSKVDNILTSITSLSEQIKNFKATYTISNPAILHDQITASINAFSNTFLETSKHISKEIAFLSDNTNTTPLDYSTIDKHKHIHFLQSELRHQIDNFQLTRVSIQDQIRNDLAHQFRMVHPRATLDEITNAVDGTLNYDDSNNNGIFSQSTLTRFNCIDGEINELSVTRARHKEIARLEQTILELDKLFNTLVMRIEEQQVHVDTIQTESENIQSNMSKGNVELDSAIDNGRRARNRKWWCLWVTLVIILMSVAVILLALWQAKVILKGAKKDAGT